MSRIVELEKLILENTANYYNGKNCVTDDQFDEWIEELRALDPAHKILHSVGWGYNPEEAEGTRQKHLNYLSGISNKPRVAKDAQLPAGRIKTPKMDGGSVELQYHKGLLVRALTRGDGVWGIDCTSKLKYIVPNELSVEYTGNIVGEYVISSEDLVGFSDSISQRNIPNGFLGRDYASEEDCKRFSFVAYKIGKSTSHTFKNRVGILNFLNSLGFLTVNYITSSCVYQEAIDRLKVIGGKTYLLDGIVSDNEDIFTYEDGVINYPDEVAYKTITSKASPKVKKINWNLTRTGKIVPTVVTEPIVLSGANIDHFLGHNAQYILEQGIGVDARLEVTRSGEVIPYILGVVDEVDPVLPTKCPSCGADLKWSGVHLICDNPDCSGQNFSKIYHWIQIMASTDNLGYALISAFIEVLQIDDIADLYKDLDLKVLLNYDGIGQSRIKILENMLKKLKSPHSLSTSLMAMNISGLGYKSAQKICSSTSIYEEIKEDYYSDKFEDQVLRLKGVNSPTKIALLKNWGRIIDLLKFVEVEPPKSQDDEDQTPDSRIKVCITGKLESLTKAKFYQAHADKIVESSVRDCDYLISNNDSGSDKYKTASKLGKPIVTESEFLKLIEEVAN